MKETNEIITEVANRLGEHIKEKIERTLSPLNVLNYIIEKRGEPVLTYNDIYDPNGHDVKDTCYGVYVSHKNEHLGFSAPAGTGELMAMEKSADGELFSTAADDFLDFFSIDMEDYNKKRLEFTNHFLKAIDENLDYESVKKTLMNEIMKNIATAIPYADIVNAYPMEEVGEYHNAYEGQCYVEDCREADNRRHMTEEELEIEKECRKQREEFEKCECNK